MEERRRFAGGEGFDEQPMPGLDAEALDLRPDAWIHAGRFRGADRSAASPASRQADVMRSMPLPPLLDQAERGEDAADHAVAQLRRSGLAHPRATAWPASRGSAATGP